MLSEDKDLEVGSLDHMVSVHLTSQEMVKLFSKVAEPFGIPTASASQSDLVCLHRILG